MKRLLCLITTALGLSGALATEKPNIVLIMCDDLGWGDVGFNGNKVIRTPHLDAMAKGGMKFNRCYAAAPVCSPTRGSCITGRHPFRYSIPFANSGHMKPEELTLAELLKKQGYTTGHFGKWHLTANDVARAPHPQEYGYDEYKGFNGPPGTAESDVAEADADAAAAAAAAVAARSTARRAGGAASGDARATRAAPRRRGGDDGNADIGARSRKRTTPDDALAANADV